MLLRTRQSCASASAVPRVARRMVFLAASGGAATLMGGCTSEPTNAVVRIGPNAPRTSDDLVAVVESAPTNRWRKDVPVLYDWSMRAGGAADFSAQPDVVGATVPASLTRKHQVWRLVVKAIDGEEVAPDSHPVTTTVLNSLPEVRSVRVTPQTGVTTLDTIRASATTFDADGDHVGLTYTWYVDGTALGVAGPTLEGRYFVRDQQVWVEVVANDGDGDSEPLASAAVVIENTPPDVDRVRVDPHPVTESSEATCVPVGWHDADDDPANIDVTWLVNGTVVSTDDVLTGRDFNRGDQISCTGVPNDLANTGSPVTSPVVTVGNAPPTIDSVVLSDGAPSALDAMTVTLGRAQDLDGDPMTFEVEWFVNGRAVFRGHPLPPRSFRRRDAVWAEVTASDGRDAGEPVRSNTATAVNSAPSITSLDLGPTELYTNDTVVPAVTADDPDGDLISYRWTWTVNGVAIAHTGTSLGGTTWFDKGDSVSVEVTPLDGSDTGIPVSSVTLDVLNSPPVGPPPAFDQAVVETDVDLVCRLASAYTDDDGDDLEYTFSWEVDGVAFTGASDGAYAGDTISADDTEDNQEWTCTVSITDGEATITHEASIEAVDWWIRTFSDCGATGPTGPSSSQCNTAYTDTALESDTLTVADGIQTWTVPTTGTYRIEVKGAQGGVGAKAKGSAHSGATMRGDFDLTAGDTLDILVGQTGLPHGLQECAGGGGGSFVVDADGDPLIIAGGGGANESAGGATSTCGGQSGSAPTAGGKSSYSCASSTTSAGGGGGYHTYHSYMMGIGYYTQFTGGGGGGWSGNGGHFRLSAAAQSYSNGGEGGDFTYCDGGFGGGGAGGSGGALADSYHEGAGSGGGYSGGTSGMFYGGGGASYNDGDNQNNSSASNAGSGQVTIDLLPAEE